jgi:hypothetical protein
MAISVREGLMDILRSGAGATARLQVTSGEDTDLVAGALRAAVHEIESLSPDDAPAIVMGPYLLPGSCLLLADFEAATPPDVLAQVPGILARHLADAGITEADIRPPQQIGARYEPLQAFTPVARAWLVGPEPKGGTGVFPSLAPALAEAGTRWIVGLARPGMEFRAVIVGMESPVTADALRQILDMLPRSGPQYIVTAVATDFSTQVASVVFGDFLSTAVTLSAAGANWSAEQVAVQMRAQRETIRACAGLPELEWAGVTAEASNDQMLMNDPWRPEYEMIGPVWYQILSQEQLRQVGSLPPGAAELPGGRIELTIGEPEQWVPGDPGHDAVLEQARRVLRPGWEG